MLGKVLSKIIAEWFEIAGYMMMNKQSGWIAILTRKRSYRRS